jgi:hypothetical protein
MDEKQFEKLSSQLKLVGNIYSPLTIIAEELKAIKKILGEMNVKMKQNTKD